MSSVPVDRSAIHAGHYVDESQLVPQLIAAAGLSGSDRERISRTAAGFVAAVRASKGTSLLETFLATYGLATDEGLALMALAEAFLRIPDSGTRDALIRDTIGSADWSRAGARSQDFLMRLSAVGLDVASAVLGERDADSVLSGLVVRLGAPVVRTAVEAAMKVMGGHFVTGRTIAEAIRHSRQTERRGYRYSYDMLGEAARTAADAERYDSAYRDAIAALAAVCRPGAVRDNPGISIKLSALHPRYEATQRERMLPALVDRTRQLALGARAADMGFNIDAEEADRLDLSLDVIEAVLATPELTGWDGFGIVVQAYGKRVLPLIDWIDALSRRHERGIMVRLVKGAYWDAEIKRAQVQGLPGFPVLTRKAATDVSYIAAARKLLSLPTLYPQFATHNAHTAAAVLHLAQEAGRSPDSYEFQRLHGMGEALHEVLRREQGTRTRIYAPVGAHEDLLGYLVRRLLENGANGSFVHQIANDGIPPETVAEDPIGKLLSVPQFPNPAITLPSDLYGNRQNSKGLDLADPVALGAVWRAREPFRTRLWTARPQPLGGGTGDEAAILNPANPADIVGTVVLPTPRDVTRAIDVAVQSRWGERPVSERAGVLRRAARLYEENRPELLALLAREAGKTWSDAVAEVREAVDFLRYYADEAEAMGSIVPRGPFAAISPWNFPLAIFTGQVAAALAAGNPVLAKPAPQTPLVAFRAAGLLVEAGVAPDALHFLPGGPEIGALLTADKRVAGVVFTGSLHTAHHIDRSMAEHLDPRAPLIAETGGINAMIMDSTALPEQAVRDILASAFQSAGQRCSALRVLFVEESVYARTVTMLKGAMDELILGNPWDAATDIGPIISEEAGAKILAYVDARRDSVIHQLSAPASGHFVGPTLLRIRDLSDVPEEIFGPVLHVATFEASDIDRVIDSINATGYGLTFCLHSRLRQRIDAVAKKVRAGNIYINRNQIGAVVGVQPFGGEGLSGTGPKAGGPAYLPRFASEVARPALARQSVLSGPTGESNVLRRLPRGRLLCLGPTREDVVAQHALAAAAGCSVLDAPGLVAEPFDAVAFFGNGPDLRSIRQALAARPGPILPLITTPAAVERLLLERHVSIDTTAAGGNATLIAMAG